MQLTSDRPQIEEVEDLPCAETPADFLLRSMDTHFANFEKNAKNRGDSAPVSISTIKSASSKPGYKKP